MALSVDSLARAQFIACQQQFIYSIPKPNAKYEFRFNPNPNFRRRGAVIVSSSGGVLNSVADKKIKKKSRNVSEKKEDTDLRMN
jgi:hypothetical protein